MHGAPAAPGGRAAGRRLRLKTRREVALQPVLREWLGRVVVPRGARVEVDVDPVSFL